MERFELDFEWRGFELHPEIPVGGMKVREVLPPQYVDDMNARLVMVANDFGLDFYPPDHAPNTKKALALSAYARDQGHLDAFRAVAMDAHWRDNRDLEDAEVLAELLTAAGLDASAGLAFLDDASVPQVLADQRKDASQWGVTGIPTWFLLPDGWSPGDPMPAEGQPRPVQVVGCQPMDVVERAARIAGARERA
jgi:predicted DsbA family dithiol-disulfide isomerase